MNTNKIVIYVTIISIVLIIGIPSIYKVIKSNQDKVKMVTYKYVIETAERCYYENVCKENIITLKDLYSYHYIKEDIVDPISKVIYSEDSYVEIDSKESKFNPVF